MKNSKDMSEYYREYNKEKRVRISLNLSKEYEADIIEAIEKEGKGNKQRGAKSLIRKGIEYERAKKYPFPKGPLPC